MTTPLTFHTASRTGGDIALIAAGEIDQSNIDAFSRALGDAIAHNANGRPVTVDLSAVDYLDSAAVNVLFTHADHIRVIANRLLIRVLNLSGVSELAPVEEAPYSAT
jgi:anti-anti-sigma factor